MLTLVELVPTSIGSPSRSCVTVVRQKLKYSEASLKITFSSATNPRRFLKKNTSLIFLVEKEAAGLESSSPTVLSAHAALLKVNVPSAFRTSWWGSVVASYSLSTPGAGASCHCPEPPVPSSATNLSQYSSPSSSGEPMTLIKYPSGPSTGRSTKFWTLPVQFLIKSPALESSTSQVKAEESFLTICKVAPCWDTV